MNPSIFQIKNLKCEYQRGYPVLHLEYLDIPRQKMVFIVGKSGIGKSTFIETLGLMNNTIAQRTGTSIRFSPNGKPPMELRDSWNLSNRELAQFRREHFSFIFQNTNLMPNFTSGENMMISLLIQGRKLPEAKREVLSVMEQLSLGKEVFDKKITEISGGQRQRLAFVRAITAGFTVLFGDEPTGNLDHGTAQELMMVLRENAIEQGRTVVIVSHDLNLAEKFADIIIPITQAVNPSTEHRTGEVRPENILFKGNPSWQRIGGEQISDIFSFLSPFLTRS